MNESKNIKLGVLTSSRADYGIYYPLLALLSKDSDIELTIFAFGMHLQEQYGFTVEHVLKDDFGKVVQVQGMSEGDGQLEIAHSYSKLIENFALVWANNEYDLIIALGDRFEMSAAVQSTIPFGLRLAHIHAGETTLGANDDIYRHQISLAAQLFFVSTSEYSEKVKQLKGSAKNVYNFGALSLDRIRRLELPAWAEVCSRFNLPKEPFVLITVHPETAGVINLEFAHQQLFSALSDLANNYQLIITLPNADHKSGELRAILQELKGAHPSKVFLIKSFGKMAYFSAIKASRFLLGNTSSGIIEAASFGKYVINLGDRQKGRVQSENVLNVPFDKHKILNAVQDIERFGDFDGQNIYEGSNTAEKIVKVLKKFVD